MFQKTIVPIAALLIIFALLVGFTFVLQSPSTEYGPGAASPPAGIQLDNSPEQIVYDFLLETQSLPPVGTSLQCCTPTLEWEKGAHNHSASDSRRAIRDVTVNKVEISTNKSLLSNLVDDDPTYSARIYVTIETADDQLHQLSIGLWDYGLLTPWTILSMGDGWKPADIRWLASTPSNGS